MTTTTLTERPAQCVNTAPQARSRFGTQQHTLSLNGRLVLTDALKAVGLPCVLFALPYGMLALVSDDDFLKLSIHEDLFISGSAVTITADRVGSTSGRVLIPHELRQWAGLTPRSEVAVVDLGARVLLMRWSQFEERRVEAAQALLEMLEARG